MLYDYLCMHTIRCCWKFSALLLNNELTTELGEFRRLPCIDAI